MENDFDLINFFQLLPKSKNEENIFNEMFNADMKGIHWAPFPLTYFSTNQASKNMKYIFFETN